MTTGDWVAIYLAFVLTVGLSFLGYALVVTYKKLIEFIDSIKELRKDE